MSISDANSMKDSASSWKCQACTKTMEQNSDGTTLLESDAALQVSSVQSGLTIEHYNALMSAIKDLKMSNDANNAAIRKDIHSLNVRLDSYFHQLSELDATVKCNGASLSE